VQQLYKNNSAFRLSVLAVLST